MNPCGECSECSAPKGVQSTEHFHQCSGRAVQSTFRAQSTLADELDARLAERVEKLKKKLSDMEATRAEFKRRRDAGLTKRHSAKLRGDQAA